MLCVALLMCLFVLCFACLTVFVNYSVKQFAMCLGVVAILLLNVMDVFSGVWWCFVGYTMYGLIKSVCVVHVIPNERLCAPSICLFVFLYVGSYLLI